MLLGLDHLVVAVRDPDAAAGELERAVGLAAGGGGRHPRWGTFNRLAWLGDTYVELIGLFDRGLAPAGAVSLAVLAALDAGREGLVSYAVASDDLAADLARLRARGSRLSDIEARSRTRPDGEVVRWRASFPPSLGPAEPPFVIEHEPVGAEWGPAARDERARVRHPLGGPARLAALDLLVPDTAATAAAYRRTLGLDADESEAGVASIRIGPQLVRLAGDSTGHRATIEIEAVDAAIDAPVREAEALGIRWRVRA